MHGHESLQSSASVRSATATTVPPPSHRPVHPADISTGRSTPAPGATVPLPSTPGEAQHSAELFGGISGETPPQPVSPIRRLSNRPIGPHCNCSQNTVAPPPLPPLSGILSAEITTTPSTITRRNPSESIADGLVGVPNLPQQRSVVVVPLGGTTPAALSPKKPTASTRSFRSAKPWMTAKNDAPAGEFCTSNAENSGFAPSSAWSKSA